MSTTYAASAHVTRPTFTVPLAAAIFFTFGLGPNYQVALLVCAGLPSAAYLLWRQGEPQMLLFLFAYQWLQIATPIFYANVRDITLSEYMGAGAEDAIVLSAIGLMSLATGIRIGAGRQQSYNVDSLRKSIGRIPAIEWGKVHLIMWGVAVLSLVIAKIIPGLSQPLLALANLKWGTFLIFTIVTFSTSSGPQRLWFGLFALEFLLSLGGYFSSFKQVFIYTLIAITAIGARITPRQVISSVIVTVAMVVVALYWTAIKPEYRAFVSGGVATQAVVVNYGEALGKIVELVGRVDSTQLENATEGLVRRFAESDVFSAVVSYVPSVRPHEWGTLWLDAISRPFMPRILFPDKAAIDESVLTNYYTGLSVGGSAEGTQVSMGYIADSYIDFGRFGMMGALLGFGLFLGWIYRWLLNRADGLALPGCGLASSTLIQAAAIGSSSAKLVGGIVVCILVAMVLLKFVVPNYLKGLLPKDHLGGRALRRRL